MFSDSEKERVELRLEGVFNSKEFADTIIAFVGLITGVSEDLSPNTSPSEWAITVEEGSALIRAMNNPDKQDSVQTVQNVAPVIHQGLAQLGSNAMKDNQPNIFFSTKVLNHIREMANLAINGQGKTVSISSDGKQVSLSSTIAENVGHILEPKKAHSSTEMSKDI
ncbi:MAG: hypothetical protein OXE59_10325 [Bacteroidetes bacterium]|nr:hypothetical protein [Bacteroidota bacterium]MCY4234117.1 hypothetical protein [Bacteroidota bacterium]